MSAPAPKFDVAIIGAGPGGIAAGVKLLQAGIGNIVLLERADMAERALHCQNASGARG